MSELPSPALAVVAQLCNVFCSGRYDAYDRLVAERGPTGDEIAAALRAAGVATCERPPTEAWHSDAVEAAPAGDAWIVTMPVWSGGRPVDARLRFRAVDPFADGLWETWIEAVEA
jgi:hypothetical protein